MISPVNFLMSFCAAVTFVGCAGSPPEPIRINQIGDRTLSCMEIEMQASRLLDQAGVLVEESERTDGHILIMVTALQLSPVPLSRNGSNRWQ